MFETENTSNESQDLEVSQDGEQGQESAEKPDASIVDLDSVEKFKFGGREWTPADFRNATMMQADYTRKTQAIAEERKYYENLSADLEAVKNNPALAAKFKSVYPEKFHNYLGYVMKEQPKPAGMREDANGNIDPAFRERFESLEKKLLEREVQAIEAELDAKDKVMSEKYPFADQEAVYARAQALHEKGEKLTDKVWESLWKGVHERNQKLAEQFYSKKVNTQKQTNQKGKDMASGGGTPGQAPRVAKSIKEATKMLYESENL